jgi:malate/lactate dehydrogenase
MRSFKFYGIELDMGDIVLVDILEGVAQGKALDIFEASPLPE